MSLILQSSNFCTHINDPPVEIIFMIMDYLPLADRKPASEVGCKWFEIAFSFVYLANVQLRLRTCLIMDKRKIMDVQKNSNKRYRNMTVDFGICRAGVLFMLVLLDKFVPCIEEFGTQPLLTPMQLKEMCITRLVSADVKNWRRPGSSVITTL